MIYDKAFMAVRRHTNRDTQEWFDYRTLSDTAEEALAAVQANSDAEQLRRFPVVRIASVWIGENCEP